MATKGVYQFFWDCGRMGDLHGVFVATDKEVRDTHGKRVYFGEVLGKHSEIEGEIDPPDIALISDDPAVVAAFESRSPIGYSPIEYLQDQN